MKRVVIVHGYKGKPETNWKPWLKRELEINGYAVDVPAMPNTEHPVASEWVTKLTEAVGEPGPHVYLVGHSLGTITILRYLETLTGSQTVGGVVLVAGFGERFPTYVAGRHDTFFDHELNWQHIRAHCQRFTAIHSPSDPHIELDQLQLFEQKLRAHAIAVEGMGHFGSADGVYEVPVVRDEVLGMSSLKQTHIS